MWSILEYCPVSETVNLSDRLFPAEICGGQEKSEPLCAENSAKTDRFLVLLCRLFLWVFRELIRKECGIMDEPKGCSIEITPDNDGCGECRKIRVVRANKNCRRGVAVDGERKRYTTNGRRLTRKKRRWRRVQKPTPVTCSLVSPPAVAPRQSLGPRRSGKLNVSSLVDKVIDDRRFLPLNTSTVLLPRCKSDDRPDLPPLSPFRATANHNNSTVDSSDISPDSIIVECEVPSPLDNHSSVGSHADSCIDYHTDPISTASFDDDHSGSTTIVRGTMHQGDSSFSEDSRGNQCSAIAMASIALSYTDDPRYWSHEDVDYILAMGDSLYQASMRARRVIPNEPLPQYLRAEEVLSDFRIGNSAADTRITDELYVDIAITDWNDHPEALRGLNGDECLIDEDCCDDSDNVTEPSSENSICDMKWIFDNLHEEFDNHSEDASCTFTKLNLVSTDNKGLSKLFKYECGNCGLSKSISSTPDTGTSLDLNSAAIIGSLTIGIGQSQLEELLGACNIHAMSNNTYQNYHGNVVDHVTIAAERQMEENREKEKALAEERGDFIIDENGKKIYFLDGEGDGGYMKRSYVNSAYTSPACIVIIIVEYTKKIIYMEVVQKSCILCVRGKQHSPEECYRNHEMEESSTSIETKAFGRIFSKTLQDKIIIRRLVSDVDAANFAAITNANPYGAYGIAVEKILCSNHLKRNIPSGIKVISRTRGEIGSIRKKIEESSKTFHDTITRCVEKVNQLQVDTSLKCRKLRADFTRLPLHIYGDHSQCAENNFDCDGQMSPGERNLVPELREKNLFIRIERVMQRAINNAKHLLMNLTTNTSESFMAIVAKTIGAKRMHFALKLSYKARCYVAFLLFNSSSSIGPICREMGKDPPQIGLKVQQYRSEKNQQRLIRRAQEDYVGNRPVRQYGADGEYGRVVDPDIDDTTMAIREADHYGILADWQADANGIEQRTWLQSLLSEWNTLRKWLITAPVMSRIYRRQPQNPSSAIVRSILYTTKPKKRDALDWGIAYEVIAKRKLRESGYNIQDCGLTMHPSVLRIAATTDGLIDHNGTLEVKCPYTARDVHPQEAITGSFHISKNFLEDSDGSHLVENQDIYCQIQGQLAATGREYCLLAIATTKGIHTMRVERNEVFIRNLMAKCQIFYGECIVPEIVNSRSYSGEKV
ncbi:hypothetical protein QAD02_013059 [Eretmocerus hayati]|uniref:Uncharacterized protein n=1 Tax=Eretmocerus hayati TaxID=131215 RepID=A0ACC2P1M2_9HYME|nr:hypothetical protein QAD02_013059 [Eretmocerus hayati]